jgi:hypothetical protein
MVVATSSILFQSSRNGEVEHVRQQADGDAIYTGYDGARAESEKSPGKDKESNWLLAPNGSFSLYIRAYWGNCMG